MTLEQFEATLSGEAPPQVTERSEGYEQGGAGRSSSDAVLNSLAAMWYEGKGDWEQAHTIAQGIPTREGAWVHAYLHRKEGDDWNANYWYNRADRSMPDYSLEREWKEMVRSLLGTLR